MVEHLHNLEGVRPSATDAASPPLLVEAIPAPQSEETVGIVHQAAIADMPLSVQPRRNVKVSPQIGFDF